MNRFSLIFCFFLGVFLVAVSFQEAAEAFPPQAPSENNVFGASMRGQLMSPICACQGCRTTSTWGYRRRFRRFHYGHDIGCPTGTPIRATTSGVVTIRSRDPDGYGRYLEISSSNNVVLASGGAYTPQQDIRTRYAHLSRFAVNRGDRVQQGQVIGYCGNDGRSTGPHLHYEVRIGGAPQDPRLFYGSDMLNYCPQNLNPSDAPGVDV